MTHKSITLGVVLLVVATAPASALSVPGLDAGPDTPTIVKQHGGHPSFIVTFDNESSSAATSLQDWANASDTRWLSDLDNESGTATVTAPRYAVDWGLGDVVSAGDFDNLMAAWRSDKLEDASYIKSVHPNWRLSNVEPVDTLANESDVPTPQIGRLAFNDPAFPTDGLAFNEDASTTTLSEARKTIGADNITGTGAGITVGVIDTGADEANGQVFGNGTSGSDSRILNASKNFISNETVDLDGFEAIADGSSSNHGTWVSASIAANTTNDTYDGMAPDADLLVLKALADDGSGSTADIAAAIRYAADQDVDVLSMSLGSPLYSQPLASAIDYAYANGVKAITVAAGNSRASGVTWVASPADAPGVISVGATNGSEPPQSWSAYFSQVGPDPGSTDNSGLATQGEGITVAAPGMAVQAQVPTSAGYTSNSTLSGTSMATPLVAGGLAAAMSENSTLASSEHGEIVAAVGSSARPTPHAATAEVGNGTFAADLVASGEYPDTEQSDAMTDAAASRDAFYEAQSDASGGFLSDVRGLFGAMRPHGIGGVVGA